MTHQAILEKAMRKAIDNGWQPNFDIKRHRLTIGFKIEKPFEASGADWSVNDIIFRRDFARALWGLEPRWNGTLKNNRMIAGEGVTLTNIANCDYHLMQMAFVDDPLTYLGANI